MKRSFTALIAAIFLFAGCSWGYRTLAKPCKRMTRPKGGIVAVWAYKESRLGEEHVSHVHDYIRYNGHDDAGNLVFTATYQTEPIKIPAKAGAEIEREKIGDLLSLRVIAIAGDDLTYMLVPSEGCPQLEAQP
jgi:hypothetical protein